MSTSTYRAALAAIVALGAALRLWQIGGESLWADEALTLAVARLPSFDLMFRPVDPTPGLYYLIHKWLAPDAVAAGEVRLLAAVAGTATILAGAALGRAASDRRGSLLMAALVAVSAPLILFSQEARAYSLCVLQITASAAGLVAYGREGRDRRALALFAVAGLGGVYAHFIGWLWIGQAAIVAWGSMRGDPERRRDLGVALLGVMLLGAPEILRTLQYGTSARDAFHWLAQPNAVALAGSWARVALPPGPWPIVALGALVVIGLAVRALTHRASGLALAVALVLALEPLGAWLFGFVVRPIAVDRSLLPAIIGTALLLVLADRSLRGWPVVPLIAVGWLAATLAWGGERTKGDWRGAAAIAARMPGRTVLLCPFYSVPALQAAAVERGVRGGPLVTVTQGFMLAIEPRLGANRAFARDYATGMMARIVPAYENSPGGLPQRATLAATARFLFIDVGCEAGDRARAARWFGPARIVPLWHGIAGREGTTIRVYAVDAAARERPMMRLPARPM